MTLNEFRLKKYWDKFIDLKKVTREYNQILIEWIPYTGAAWGILKKSKLEKPSGHKKSFTTGKCIK